METRSLGRTGVQVSPLCLGCMMFGRKTEPEESYRMIAHAVDAGINFLDTANVYSRGRSEELTGEGIKRIGKRDQIVLATKVHGKMDDDDPNMLGNSRRHIISQCEASLRRLQTDYIDLYQIHRPDPQIPIDETLGALDDLVRAGKIRYAGSSTFAAWQLMESVAVSSRKNITRFICEQAPYNLMDRRIERELVPFARTYGFAIIPWSPLAGGLLTGKYRPGQIPEDARFSDIKDKPWMARRVNDAALEKAAAFADLCGEANLAPSQAALAWAMQRPGITSPIIGPRSMQQLEDNLRALEITLEESFLEKLDEIFPPGRATSLFYEANFGPHPLGPLIA